MGDIVSLVERVQENVDQAEAERTAQRMMENRFTLEDFRSQLDQIKRMGPISPAVGMIPGAGQMAGRRRRSTGGDEADRGDHRLDDAR